MKKILLFALIATFSLPVSAQEGDVNLPWSGNEVKILTSLDLSGNDDFKSVENLNKIKVIIQFLHTDQNNRIQLNSYSAKRDGVVSKTRQMSLKQALKLRNLLLNKGVKSDHIIIKALGNGSQVNMADKVDVIAL